jgi:hypothetical protein
VETLEITKLEELDARIDVLRRRVDTQAEVLSRAIAETNWALNETITYLQKLADSRPGVIQNA